MSLNNKGFAISGVLYSLLILFVTLFIGILTIFATTKFSFDKVKNDIISKLEPKTLKDIVTTSDGNPSIPDCITNNTECEAGTGIAIKVNDSETYDFYVISEDTENNKITLIMNRNLDGTVAWSSDRSEGPVTALAYLESKTAGWTNIPNETYTLTDERSNYPEMTRTARARLITYTETYELGCTPSKGSCPEWLYINTRNHGDDSNYGYWTSSTSTANARDVKTVEYSGCVDFSVSYVDDDNSLGVRPVITIKKS